MKTTRPIYALVGPTGAGKSAVALACAKLLDGEVIGCDSVQIYRGFDVGSAKPDAAARAAVRHHVVDSVAAQAPFDAAAYVEAVRLAVADIHGRGKAALLCGGTGLYVRALTHGPIAVPANAALRAELAQTYGDDCAAMHARLAQLDPEGAAKLSPNNPAYLLRALEISLLTGRPASVVRAEQARVARPPQGVPPLRLLALDGATPWLRARIAARTDDMLAQGLVAEVAHLLATGLDPQCAPMRAVGYREAVEVLRGSRAPETLGAAIFASTWAYARRQRTWWRRQPPFASLDAKGALTAQLAERAVATWRAADAAALEGTRGSAGT